MQNTMQIMELSPCEPAKYKYKKSSYAEVYEVFQSLRKDEVFCDIKIETDDGSFIFGHKVILASASLYFHAMFTHFAEKNQDNVVIRRIDFTSLQLLIDFIYSGEIIVTEKNVEGLLQAANLLQLQEVKEACCTFLQAQIGLTNCFGINALADLYSCMELKISSELYIRQHFSHVVEGEEFLSIPLELMVKLIASEELVVLSEAKVFECVILWVKHDLVSRNQFLPQLMEHVRLPLLPKNYILQKVVEEPLINNCLKCKVYVNEAIYFHSLMPDDLVNIPNNIRTQPRQRCGYHKGILVVGGMGKSKIISDSTEWYDPIINQWQPGPQLITPRFSGGLAVIKDNFVFYMGGYNSNVTYKSLEILDLSSESPCWKQSVDMLVKRRHLGVGVINNYIYAVGGSNGYTCLNSAEVFDCTTQEWRMISSMSTSRNFVGIGVLNNLLYAIGGYNSKGSLKSVECYHPHLDKWTLVAEMRIPRSAMGVGVLNGVLYVVGGHNGIMLRGVEAYRPSTGVWTTIPDMHYRRSNAGVAVLDGLLYVVGGFDGVCKLKSAEFYNPNTNTWTMVTTSMNVNQHFLGAVAIDNPRHFKTFHS